MVKVVKFGGSSLASAEQFTKVGDIIRSDESRKYVVPSAPGKRNSKDTKVTDMLYACYDLAENDQDFKVMLRKIKDRYDSIINGLHLKLALDEEFKIIAENFKAKAGADYAASRGEYLNGIIMANYLGYEFIDSATVIFLMRMAILTRKRQTRCSQRSLSRQKRLLFRAFTEQDLMERLLPSQEVVRISLVPSYQRHVMPACMRTGQMFQDVS